MGRALNFAHSNSETIHLMQTAKTIRRDMSTINQNFCGVFTSNSEIDSVTSITVKHDTWNAREQYM